MDINNSTHITSLDDVKEFFKYLYKDKKLNLHPDDLFTEDMGNVTTDEAPLFNRLMDECFDVCEMTNTDIYGICLEVY